MQFRVNAAQRQGFRNYRGTLDEWHQLLIRCVIYPLGTGAKLGEADMLPGKGERKPFVEPVAGQFLLNYAHVRTQQHT